MKRQKIRAPKRDGESVLLPEGSCQSLLEANRGFAGKTDIGFPLDFSETRRLARVELVKQAHRFTSQYANIEPLDDPNLLFLTGHQPELFHPGVWFKNFVLHRLAAIRNESGGRVALAVNLLVDNDLCDEVSLVVPAGNRDCPKKQSISLDADSPPLPFEVRSWRTPVSSPEFIRRVQSAMGSLSGHDRLLTRFLAHLDEARRGKTLVGESFAEARHRLEMEHGISNLEIPLSRICESLPFRKFLAAMIVEGRQLHREYNASLRQFRKDCRIRSQTHPVPELSQSEEWLELPFWIWRKNSPERGRLHVCFQGDRIRISDRNRIEISGTATRLESVLQDACAGEEGVVVRPRALMTTLYVRLFLADLFVHGIGGAKYDQLTDEIIRRLFGMHPPGYLTATSTHRLPLGIEPFDDQRWQQFKKTVRERKYRPEQFGPSTGKMAEFRDLVGKKQDLLQRMPRRGNKKSWHHEMEALNGRLLELNQPAYQESIRSLQIYEKTAPQRALLCSREFSFVLHPPQLVDHLKQLAERAIPHSD
ncbi:MAG: hypothetical protein VX768_16175 [Planctomycetota bacterium]|nr:hypothetical protein [Planctomycetota bacterium]